MKKRALCATLILMLSFTLSSHTVAIESGVNIVVNGVTIDSSVAAQPIDGTTYVSYVSIVEALYPEATSVWQNGRAEVRATGLSLNITPGLPYIEANGRYLYTPQGIITQNDNILVPVRALCMALGATVTWVDASDTILITGGSPIRSGDQAYNADDLYWLSHIINAESGNQPLTGKIAVGNVVMNRVASGRFPNTMQGVIYQRNQFTPVANGSIKLTPNAESVIAAKLCLDGANTVGNSLYFVNPKASPNCWASRNRPYVATIGAHAFFA